MVGLGLYFGFCVFFLGGLLRCVGLGVLFAFGATFGGFDLLFVCLAGFVLIGVWFVFWGVLLC